MEIHENQQKGNKVSQFIWFFKTPPPWVSWTSYIVGPQSSLSYLSQGLKGPDIVNAIEKGDRLAQPANCPEYVYKIMHDCWQYKEQDRPTFNEVGSRLHHHLQSSGQNIAETTTGPSAGQRVRGSTRGEETGGDFTI